MSSVELLIGAPEALVTLTFVQVVSAAINIEDIEASHSRMNRRELEVESLGFDLCHGGWTQFIKLSADLLYAFVGFENVPSSCIEADQTPVHLGLLLWLR